MIGLAIFYSFYAIGTLFLVIAVMTKKEDWKYRALAMSTVFLFYSMLYYIIAKPKDPWWDQLLIASGAIILGKIGIDIIYTLFRLGSIATDIRKLVKEEFPSLKKEVEIVKVEVKNLDKRLSRAENKLNHRRRR